MEMGKNEPIDWHPDPKVRAMQLELQQWMEKNDLTHDTGWCRPEDHFGDDLKDWAEQPCLVLWFEGELYKVMWPGCYSDHPDYSYYEKLNTEFDEIVKRHGFWYEYEDNVTAYFMLA